MFVPTDAAFAAMAAPVQERLNAVGLPMVKSLVRGHLVQGAFSLDQL